MISVGLHHLAATVLRRARRPSSSSPPSGRRRGLGEDRADPAEVDGHHLRPCALRRARPRGTADVRATSPPTWTASSASSGDLASLVSSGTPPGALHPHRRRDTRDRGPACPRRVKPRGPRPASTASVPVTCWTPLLLIPRRIHPPSRSSFLSALLLSFSRSTSFLCFLSRRFPPPLPFLSSLLFSVFPSSRSFLPFSLFSSSPLSLPFSYSISSPSPFPFAFLVFPQPPCPVGQLRSLPEPRRP